MSKSNPGAIKITTNKEVIHFDAPFYIPETININRVTRYKVKKCNEKKSTLLSLIRTGLVVVPFILVIWILIAITASLFTNPDSSRFSLVIIVLDFFVVSFAGGVTLEFHDFIKNKR
jgi:hypothetical protein